MDQALAVFALAWPVSQTWLWSCSNCQAALKWVQLQTCFRSLWPRFSFFLPIYQTNVLALSQGECENSNGDLSFTFTRHIISKWELAPGGTMELEPHDEKLSHRSFWRFQSAIPLWNHRIRTSEKCINHCLIEGAWTFAVAPRAALQYVVAMALNMLWTYRTCSLENPTQ